MKVFVTRSSGNKGESKDFKSLDDCVQTLLNTENFGGFENALVIRRPCDSVFYKEVNCDYIVEIYDTWRE